MTVRRIIETAARAPLRRASRLIRLLAVLVVSMIGLGLIQTAGESVLEDEADRDERVVFRHFV